MDSKNEGIFVDMTGSSLKRKQKEAQKYNKEILEKHELTMLPNISMRKLFQEAYQAAIWVLDTMSKKTLASAGSYDNLIRGLGFILVIIGLSGVFIYEAF